MATHTQIDISNGKQTVRIHDRQGYPRYILSDLRLAAASGRKTLQAIVREYLRLAGGTIITEDFQRDALNFHYKVDVSTTPWKVVQESCPVYKIIDNGDGTAHISPTITPARFRTLFIKTKAAAAAAGSDKLSPSFSAAAGRPMYWKG